MWESRGRGDGWRREMQMPENERRGRASCKMQMQL
jgi:hypothetical protein